MLKSVLVLSTQDYCCSLPKGFRLSSTEVEIEAVNQSRTSYESVAGSIVLSALL